MRYFLLSFLITYYLVAQGTIAGTIIDNKMNIYFNVGDSDVTHNIQSNVDSFVIDRVVDIKTSWQDVQAVEVSPSEKDRVLSFKLDNLGNGEDNITLEHINESNSTFNVDNMRLFKDTNENGIFDSNDTLIDQVSLMADKSVLLFLVSDIADVNGTLSYGSILAKSSSVTTTTEDNQDSVDVIVREGESKSIGIYELRDYFLETKKSAKVLSEDGKAHTGTVIEYTIYVKIIGGEGKFENVIIKDIINNSMTYEVGSLKLNGNSLTDGIDNDQGEFQNNSILVKIGSISNINDINNYSEITFRAKIK